MVDREERAREWGLYVVQVGEQLLWCVPQEGGEACGVHVRLDADHRLLRDVAFRDLVGGLVVPFQDVAYVRGKGLRAAWADSTPFR